LAAPHLRANGGAGGRKYPQISHPEATQPLHAGRRIGLMLRRLIEKEVSAVKDAIHALRERIHPTKVMKRQEFDRPLDDLGQSINDVERRAQRSESKSAAKSTP